MKILKIIFILSLALFFTSCLAKYAPKARIYELSTQGCAKNSLKIAQVSSTMALNTRSIYIKENNELKELENAKFISFGEDMLESALIKYFSCSNANNQKSLNITLLELYATKNQAIISAKANINEKEKFLSATNNIDEFSQDNIIKALNLALDKLLNQIDEFANENL